MHVRHTSMLGDEGGARGVGGGSRGLGAGGRLGC